MTLGHANAPRVAQQIQVAEGGESPAVAVPTNEGRGVAGALPAGGLAARDPHRVAAAGQVAAMPTIGALSRWPPMEP
jgi:hypothetical protein